VSGRNGPAIELLDVSKSFGNGLVVSNVTFAVEKGSCFGLLGPNGAGKTTTLKMIYGFWKPSAGAVRVEGIDVRKDPRRVKRLLGIAPQENTLDPDLTVSQNLSFHARYAGMHPGQARDRVRRVRELLGLDSHADAAVAELSSGLRRRLVLARTFLNEPNIVILDEPTRGLDQESRDLTVGLLREMKSRGVTMVIATHGLEEASALCDRVALMKDGRIFETGTASEILPAVGNGAEPSGKERGSP